MKRSPLNRVKSSPHSLFVTGILGLIVGLSAATFISKESSSRHQQGYPQSESVISVCFTPNKLCERLILDEIEAAKKTILVQAYSFTDPFITAALVVAFKRGVDVRVLLDKSNLSDGHSQKDYIIQNGIPIRFDRPQGIAHNKVIIIDDLRTLTGSYNFSKAAYTRNTENLLIISNSRLAMDYRANWEKRWDISYEHTP